MTRITWIIIVLIVLSICITCLEVLLRFAILTKQGKGRVADGMPMQVNALRGVSPPALAGPGLLAARGIVWVGSGVKGIVM